MGETRSHPVSFHFDEAAGSLSVHFAGGAARAVLEPLALETPQGRIDGRWERFASNGEAGFLAQGRLEHPDGQLHFTVNLLANSIYPSINRAGGRGAPACAPRAKGDHGPGSTRAFGMLPTNSLTVSAFTSTLPDSLLELDWKVEFDGACHGAICQAIRLLGVTGDPARLTLPGVFYGQNPYGKGIFPKPDPARGFAFRADRLPQPALHYAAPEAAWDYFAAGEAPAVTEPEMVYSLGTDGGEAGLRLFFRYPQVEFGQRGDGGPDAYVAKSAFAAGENRFTAWKTGDRLEKTLFLSCRPQPERASAADPARFLWQRAYPTRPSAPAVDLWQTAGERLRWINERLYKPDLFGGQYESPEGSGTAMLGFVEQSLAMASVTLRYVLATLSRPVSFLPAETLERWGQRAAHVLNRWTSQGLSPEGLLYPACDEHGYAFGVRDYADHETLAIRKDHTFETQRLTGEARQLLAAARAVRSSGGQVAGALPEQWEQAAASVGGWLAGHALPGGGHAARYTRHGEPVEPDPAGTAFAISLFCDLARQDVDTNNVLLPWLRIAKEGYHSRLAEMVRKDFFSGGTLDASTPDREAAIAALDACMRLFELTRDRAYLADARHAVDNLLTYTFVYPIRTFGMDTDAARRQISTFGGTLVSPENQHLDPFPLGVSLLKYGSYAEDPIARQAAIESLHFCLDGRWAIVEKEGLKQPEQFAHTRWHYNDYFTRRGNYRRGMPIFGLPDSEHGWCQVLAVAALLDMAQDNPQPR